MFHLTALFALTAALVSALVSPAPTTAALKVLGLFLLFLYSASGARLAFHGHEVNFTRGLLLGCEVVAYGSALFYLVLHIPVFGNPNALGAVMGVVVVPVLLWGLFVEPGEIGTAPAYTRVAAVRISTLFDARSRRDPRCRAGYRGAMSGTPPATLVIAYRLCGGFLSGCRGCG